MRVLLLVFLLSVIADEFVDGGHVRKTVWQSAVYHGHQANRGVRDWLRSYGV